MHKAVESRTTQVLGWIVGMCGQVQRCWPELPRQRGVIQEDIIETHLKQTPDLRRKQAHLRRYRFSKVYRSAISGFLKNCDGNFLIGDDLQLRCRWAWRQCCQCCVRWCGMRLIGKGRCRYSQKQFEVAPARWHSGWITLVNMEGA